MPGKTYTPADIALISRFVNDLQQRTVTISSTELSGTITSLRSAERYFNRNPHATYARLGEHDFLPRLIERNYQFFDAFNELESALPTDKTLNYDYVDTEDKIREKISTLKQELTALRAHLQTSNDPALADFKKEVAEVNSIIETLESSDNLDTGFPTFEDYHTALSEGGGYDTASPESQSYLDVVPQPESSIAINANTASMLSPNNVEIYGYLAADKCPTDSWPSNIPKVKLTREQIEALDSEEGLKLFMPGNETYTLKRASGQFTASYGKEVDPDDAAAVSTIVNMIDNLVAQSTNHPISLTIQSNDENFKTVAKAYLAMLKQNGKDIDCTLNTEKVDFKKVDVTVLSNFYTQIEQQSQTYKETASASSALPSSDGGAGLNRGLSPAPDTTYHHLKPDPDRAAKNRRPGQ